MAPKKRKNNDGSAAGGESIAAPSQLHSVTCGREEGDELLKEAAGCVTAPYGQRQRRESIGAVHAANPQEVALLQAALSSRGCRNTLAELHINLEVLRRDVSSGTLRLLVALEQLVSTCCQPTAAVTFGGSRTRHYAFGLAVFYSDDFPPNPSDRVFKSGMRYLACRRRTQ